MSTNEKTDAGTPQSPRLTPASFEDIVGCRASILWSLRTLQVGTGVFDHSYDDFAAYVARDDDYGADLVELYKAIELDKQYAKRRREVAERVLAWIGAALEARKDAATNAALRQPIDLERLPKMPIIPARYMNDLRPALPWPYD